MTHPEPAVNPDSLPPIIWDEQGDATFSRRQAFAGMILSLGSLEACEQAYQQGYNDGRVDRD